MAEMGQNRALEPAVAGWKTEECGGLLTDTLLLLSNEERRMSLVMA
jgi:hypothetical protein